MLHATVRCHQGKVREVNEDSVLESHAHGVWAVADGVGGNGHGDMASQLVVQAIERAVRQGEPLRSALLKADAAIRSAIAEDAGLAAMASTVVACKVEGEHFEISWVGDSRAYLIDQGGIHRMTYDHNVAADLLADGSLSAAECEEHPGQHELTQAMGKLSLHEIPRNLGEFHEGDRLLLCSDGLSGVLPESQIRQLVTASDDLEQVADNVIQAVLAAGAPDNVALALLQWQPEPEPIQARDFEDRGLRFPFDRRAYAEHCKQRPWVLLLILAAILAVIFLV